MAIDATRITIGALRLGVEAVGRRKRPGRLNGVWRDVLLLERRSAVVD
jgi:L-amino acid N-acyltransferase YncA